MRGGPTAAMSGITFQVIDSTTSQGRSHPDNRCGTARPSSPTCRWAAIPCTKCPTPTDYQALPDSPFHDLGRPDRGGTPAHRQRHRRQGVGDDQAHQGRLRVGRRRWRGPCSRFTTPRATNVISNASGPITATSNASGVIELDNVPYGDYVAQGDDARSQSRGLPRHPDLAARQQHGDRQVHDWPSAISLIISPRELSASPRPTGQRRSQAPSSR